MKPFNNLLWPKLEDGQEVEAPADVQFVTATVAGQGEGDPTLTIAGKMAFEICLPLDVIMDNIVGGRTDHDKARLITSLIMERVLLDFALEITPQMCTEIERKLALVMDTECN